METKTYSYTENYEDINAPAYPNSRFVHITKFNVAMFFAIIEMSRILDEKEEIRYDDLKEFTRQGWIHDDPPIPPNMYSAAFEQAYKNLLELNMIREEIRDLAGVETKYVIISKLPFLKDMKRTFKFISFILKLYFWKKNTNMNKEVSNNE